MAIERLEKISREEQLRNIAESRERSAMAWELDRQGLLEEGMEQGIAKGMEQGIAKGMEKGIDEGMETVALRMLKDGYELSAISKITGLSEAKIKQLK